MILGQKLKNLLLIPSEYFLFFRKHLILGRKFAFILESQTIFCLFRKVQKNHDLGKTSLPPKFFWLLRHAFSEQAYQLHDQPSEVTARH